MPNIVIVSKDQSQYILEMRNSLYKYLPNLKRIFVFDRDVKGINEAKRLHENFVLNTEGYGFQAGRCRDLGLKVLGDNDTLFLDGDRILVGINQEWIEKALSLYDICLIRSQYEIRTIFARTFQSNPLFDLFDNAVYTCGFVIRKSMIEKVKNVQGGRLFHPYFDGEFGEEDRFLGSLIHYLGGTCGTFPYSAFVKGKFRRNKNKKNLYLQIKKRNKLIMLIESLIKQYGYIPSISEGLLYEKV